MPILMILEWFCCSRFGLIGCAFSSGLLIDTSCCQGFVASFVLFALLLRKNCCCKAALKVHLLAEMIFCCSLIFLFANFAALLVRLLYLRKRLMWQNGKEISLLLVLQRKI